MRVLIIDDEILIAKSLYSVALSRGHNAKMAHDGFLGLKIWKQFKPHLVFLDILMPKMDGPCVLEKAKKQSHEKVVMMSAHTAFLDDPYIPGVDLFISKPFKNILTTFIKAERICFAGEQKECAL